MEGSFKRALRHAAIYNVVREHRATGIRRRDIGPKVFGKPGFKHLTERSAWRTLDRDLRWMVRNYLLIKTYPGPLYFPRNAHDTTPATKAAADDPAAASP